MKRKLLLGLGLLLSVSVAKAQWANQSSLWNYGFSAATAGTFSTTTSNAENFSTSSTPFLPAPPSGISRVGLLANTAGTFVLNPTLNHLTITGSTTAGSKFSAYNIVGASEIASISFVVTLSNPNSQTPTYYFSMGTKAAAGNLYNNNNSVFTGANSGGALFNAIRFLFNASNVTLGHRNLGNSTGNYVTLSGGNLVYDNSYRMELYMNNSSGPKSYTRGASSYDVASKSYHLWVTNLTAGTAAVRYSYASSFDLARPTETNTTNSTDATIPENAPLNSFLFQSINITGNTTSLKIESDIQLAYNETTLPVNLISFTGKKTNNGIALNWITAAEENNDYFEIARSGEDKLFTTISSVKGKGTTGETSNYSFVDRSPLSGVNYYQLKQVDKDGTVTVFKEPVAVNYGLTEAPFTVYANRDQLNVSAFSEVAGTATLSVYDLQGKKVYGTSVQLAAGQNTFTVDAGKIGTGIYVARLLNAGVAKSVKFTKK